MKQFCYMLIILALFACKKEECEESNPSNDSYISSCLHPYLFDENSLWVFQDTSTLINDTVTVSSWSHDIQDAKNSPGECGSTWKTEYYLFNFSSTLNGVYQEEYRSSSLKNTQYGNIWIFPCNTTLDSLEVNDSTYYNITRTVVSPQVVLYYTPNVGIIRKELTDSVTSIHDLIYSDINVLAPVQ